MNKVLSTLGLARRAKKIVFGTDAIIDELSNKKLDIIFVASDASEKTIDKIERKGYFYNVPVNKSFTSDELNNSMGTYNIKVFGLVDYGFYKSIKNLLLEEVEREK